MLRSTLRRPLALFSMAGLLAMPAALSDPVGVYAVVDRVVLEPSATSPTAVQVWGTFRISKQEPGDDYSPPVKGYLYYAINPANERASRAEWTDLQGVAGKKQIVAFGAKWQQNRRTLGRVRCASEKPASPDVYPLGIGVMKTFGS